MDFENLKFRRQFLLTTEAVVGLDNWQRYDLGTHLLYAHPDLTVFAAEAEQAEAVLLGHVLDPGNAARTEVAILKGIIAKPQPTAIAEQLYGLSGRFVLIIKTAEGLLFFNDACGLRSFFYTEHQGALQVASQPLLLKMVVADKVAQGARYASFFESEYVRNHRENWFPSGTSLYEGVHHLVPNHYLDSRTMQQKRYWPVQQHQIEDYRPASEKFRELLQSTLAVGAKKYSLGLGVTAGFDSRIILSACRPVKDRMQFYTLKYRDMNHASRDIRIPTKLNKIMHFNHQVMDCQIPVDAEFAQIYQQNSDMAFLDDWGFIAYGISQNLKEGTVAIKGSCSETGRCYFYKSGKHPVLTSGADLLNYNPNWKGIGFIEERLEQWFNEVNHPKAHLGYPILDLFHWEVSTGSWQTQNQLEWDMVHETFTPFNNRELLDTMLRIDPKYRSKPKNYQLYRDTISKLWPEALSQPVNPPSTIDWIKTAIKSVLVKMGMEKYNH
ncbi:hypothetical protein [Maribacter sp. 2307ULW6-5]|uniref:hypothetical protein n=1 Tax=Maribacter sp. 2307ULW6-5 TaxID=3386275 RepID=UPI0039BD8EFF